MELKFTFPVYTQINPLTLETIGNESCSSQSSESSSTCSDKPTLDDSIKQHSTSAPLVPYFESIHPSSSGYSLNKRSNSLSSACTASSAASSIRSNYSNASSLRYGGLSENTFMGIKELYDLGAHFFKTDWKMSKFQAVKGIMFVTKYYEEYNHR